MRFFPTLHLLRHRRNAKLHRRAGLIALLWFLVVILILAFIVYKSNLDSTQLYLGFLVSFGRLIIAYVIALISAIIIALLITSHPVIEGFFLPIFDVLQSFPSFALFPVLVEVLQNHPEFIIILVLSLSMVWEILFTLIGALKNRREDLEEAATIFKATGWKRLIFFTLPHLMPAIVTGSIIGWGEGWEFIIGAELLVNIHSGIGYYLGVLGNSHQDTLLAFGITVLMFLIFIINKSIWIPLLHRVTEFEAES